MKQKQAHLELIKRLPEHWRSGKHLSFSTFSLRTLMVELKEQTIKLKTSKGEHMAFEISNDFAYVYFWSVREKLMKNRQLNSLQIPSSASQRVVGRLKPVKEPT